MATLQLTARGDAPADLAWERYAVLARWPDWSAQVRGVDASAARIGRGVTGSVIGPVGVSVRFVIEQVDETARRWSWRVGVGPVRLWLGHGVDPHPDGCSTTLTIDGPLPVATAYAPLARVALSRLVRA